MIEYNGVAYVLNIRKVFEIMSEGTNNDTKEQELTDGYELVSDRDEGLTLTSRIVHEIKAPADVQVNTIKYDFLKIIIGQVLDIEDWNAHTFGDEIAMNTLITEGILQEIK